ncbi:MAG: hypothetical protein H6709_02750 [Kofleriaceae bacterium]|nr:hypothetical protein [Kofleriaceae bacterium]MCB9570986.1 hypothetical protein [Kofleriaceae bacterium]
MRSRLATSIVLLCAAAAACGPAPTGQIAPIIVEADRFPHDRHADVACVACHDPAAVAAGVVQIPGAHDHAPCDDGRCHRAAFEAAPGPLCRICHIAVDPTGATPPLMVAYPRTSGWRVLPARFSHASHLDPARMEAAVGFHVACVDCHPDGDADAPRIGGHDECARCHAEEVRLAGAPSMQQCEGCHDADAREERHRRRLITGDLHFDHRNHRQDVRGQDVRCQTCHAQSPRATGRADHAAPAIAACVACHDDSDRTPATMRMRVCQTCHTTVEDAIGQLAPRSHLPATERPVDHTLAFRRDHGEDAARDARRCAGCHTQMSGNAHAACDECHQTMRPTDHNVMFRELDHGTSASTDPERCATCHVVDYCVACHQQRPRSHLVGWDQEHGQRARLNPRACLVCHGPEAPVTCSGPGTGCHTGGIR